MTDSSKKQTSKTQGVGFQKTDNEPESKASESSQAEKAPEMTDAKKTEPKKSEPEVPTESISVSPVAADEPVKPEVPSPKPPEPKSEPVSATQPEVAPKPEPVSAVKLNAETKAEPVNMVKPPTEETKPQPMSDSMKPPEVKPEPINVVKPPAETKAEPTTAPTVPVIVEEEPAMLETSQFDIQALKDKVVNVISDLPEAFSNFFSEYQRPLWTVVGIILIIITAKALVGVLDSVNDVPLVKSTLEIVGMGYSVWFVYRYLLRSETRQELLAKFQSWKAEFLGEEDSL
ncbi:CAAD domain-containing protein [Capilliphycus salinus ALCB114379]|uniref:CAAD domain-containing protein n=1 Tax=Capilliphycus salinus TaxID=2768948 RepID=UPI0039A55289